MINDANYFKIFLRHFLSKIWNDKKFIKANPEFH